MGLTVNAQDSSKGMVAVDSISIPEITTATVLDWFKVIEDKGMVLSYNSSYINLSEKIRLERRKYSVKEFLNIILYKYNFKADYTTGRKILLQIKGIKNFKLIGKITDQETDQPLDGCAVMLKPMNGHTFSTLTNEEGTFTIKIPFGRYILHTTHIGYSIFTKEVTVDKNIHMRINMSQTAIPLKEVNIHTSPLQDEVNYKGTASFLSVSANDAFAQLSTLPGITGSVVSGNFHVNGGQNDENLILMDGVSIYHSHHNNSLLSQFNGESVKKISFFDSFIPAQYEGRLSSVTDVRIKEGDSTEHHQSLGIDLPSASLTFDGPIIKDKFTYMISGRHSWIDFMRDLFSEAPKSSRTFNDLTNKLSYKINHKMSLEGLIYRSNDQYNDSIDQFVNQKILEWKNRLYSLSFHAQLAKKITHSTILSYSEYKNSIFAPVINIPAHIFINEGMRHFTLKTDFSKKLDDDIKLSWGLSAACERYNLLAAKDTVENAFQKVTQISAYLNSKMRITDKLFGSVALNMVSYVPANNKSFFSVQPRFTLRYLINHHNLLSVDFSRMEQFYHNICLGEIPLPTDLRMPSINGFKPSSSIHCEIGWKHIENTWRASISTYYKRRYDILGIRYHTAE